MLQVHRVDLLKGPALALDDKEEDNQAADEVATSKDVAQGEVDVAGDKGGEEGEQEVPQPVAGRCQGHALCAVLGWVELGNDGPHHRSPCRCEPEDEQTSKDDEGDTGLGRGCRVVLVEDEVAHGGKDHEAHEHPKTAKDQALATTKVLDEVETNECNAKVDTVQDQLRDER